MNDRNSSIEASRTDLQAELIRVVQRLSACRDVDSIMTVLRETARALTGADGITVVLREGDLCHYAEEDAISPLWKGRRFPMETCISGWCMLNRQQVAIADIYTDERIPHDAYRPTFVKSLAMTPIRADDPLGAIGAYWASPHEATPQELTLLQALGDSAALAFANAQLFATLQLLNRRKDEFLFMLAHELRNPLAPIRNALHLLRVGARDGASVERAQHVMERQVRHLARLIEELLDVARINSGKMTLRRERLDLARLVRHTCDDRRGILESAGLALDVEIPASPVWVNGDHTRLIQVLGNVLDNAQKYTPAGGRVSVQLSMEEAPRHAVLCVRDTGVGIGQEMLAHIFDVFVQADQSVDRAHGGLGLGLSVAKSILELHEGSIRAASDGAGRGAEFTVRLPCEGEPAALAARASTVSATTGKALRVLVVEDNLDAAESLRMLLEDSGFEVRVEHTGPSGVEAAKSMQPDIVLCDIGLPGMTGFAVAAALRGDPLTATARLIAVTGYGRDEDRQRSKEVGFEAHLVKPVEPEMLLGHLACPPPLPAG